MLGEVPPPTTHSVPRTQRLRLMRSTRKLGAILGTTPFLVDAGDLTLTCASPSPTPHLPSSEINPNRHSCTLSFDSRLGSEDTGTPAALLPAPVPVQRSPSSSSSSSASSISIQRPTLLLRINTVPTRSGGRRRAPSQAWGRPGAPPPSPLSPLASPWSDDANNVVGAGADALGLAALRRKKMARLARTLGENVPPELVFPSSHNTERTEKPKPKYSLERLSFEVEVESEDVDDEGEREADGEGSRPPSPLVFKRTSTETQVLVTVDRDGGADVLQRRASSAFESGSYVAPAGVRRSPSQQRRNTYIMRRVETGWMGEWNQDEEAVGKALRELK
ncbi:hypothetical protein C8R46DRAFT_1246468 [Mycena filopes]|nr:hypothetical protein C8R46DRAFT_1246468 [Mycena filopes]